MTRRTLGSEVVFLRALVTTLTRQNEALLAQNQKLIDSLTFVQVDGHQKNGEEDDKLRKVENYIAEVDGAYHDEELGDTE